MSPLRTWVHSLNQVVCFLLVESREFLVYSESHFFFGYIFCKYFLPLSGLSFHSSEGCCPCCLVKSAAPRARTIEEYRIREQTKNIGVPGCARFVTRCDNEKEPMWQGGGELGFCPQPLACTPSAHFQGPSPRSCSGSLLKCRVSIFDFAIWLPSGSSDSLSVSSGSSSSLPPAVTGSGCSSWDSGLPSCTSSSLPPFPASRACHGNCSQHRQGGLRLLHATFLLILLSVPSILSAGLMLPPCVRTPTGVRRSQGSLSPFSGSPHTS